MVVGGWGSAGEAHGVGVHGGGWLGWGWAWRDGDGDVGCNVAEDEKPGEGGLNGDGDECSGSDVKQPRR